MRKTSLILLILLLASNLTGCSKAEENDTQDVVNTYEAGYELSLGYGLPSITFEDDYYDWELDNDHFGGKKVDEAYISDNGSIPRIAVYRSKNDAENVVDVANQDIEKYGLSDQGVYSVYFEDDIECAYYSYFTTIDDESFIAEEYYYKGTTEYVNLELLTLANYENIDETEINILLPSTYMISEDDDTYAIYNDNEDNLPSIYIYKEPITSNIDYSIPEYYEPEEIDDVDLDTIEYEDLLEDSNNDVTTITNNIDAIAELNNYLNEMYEYFEINSSEISKTSKDGAEVDYLKIDYPYIIDDIRYNAIEYCFISGEYMYRIVICSQDDNKIQLEKAEIIAATIGLK